MGDYRLEIGSIAVWTDCGIDGEQNQLAIYQKVQRNECSDSIHSVYSGHCGVGDSPVFGTESHTETFDHCLLWTAHIQYGIGCEHVSQIMGNLQGERGRIYKLL